MNLTDWFDEKCRLIDELIAAGKLDRYPREAEVVPHLINVFGCTSREATETVREWERRHGIR